jgi:hypothetical protein
MVPQLVASLALLSLTWHELRWPAVGVAAFGGLLVLAAVTAPCVSRLRMGRWATVCCAIAVAALVAAGTLAVAPGTTDGYGYWVAGESGILIGVIFFVRGAWAGGAALLLDLAVLTAGLLAVGNAMPGGGWVGILASPVLGGGLGAGFRLAFRSLASSTERQLAGYQERLRRQARAEAMRRVDRTALDHARRVAGPILARVAGGEPAGPGLRTAAELGGATLRDELLAPGFLPGELAGRVREARREGARITVQSPRPRDPELAAAARDLLAAAIGPRPAAEADRAAREAGAGSGGASGGGAAEVTLHIHPPAGGQRALLIMRVGARAGAPVLAQAGAPVGAAAGLAAIRDQAARHRARLSELAGGDVLVRLEAANRPARPGQPPGRGGPPGQTGPAGRDSPLPAVRLGPPQDPVGDPAGPGTLRGRLRPGRLPGCRAGPERTHDLRRIPGRRPLGHPADGGGGRAGRRAAPRRGPGGCRGGGWCGRAAAGRRGPGGGGGRGRTGRGRTGLRWAGRGRRRGGGTLRCRLGGGRGDGRRRAAGGLRCRLGGRHDGRRRTAGGLRRGCRGRRSGLAGRLVRRRRTGHDGDRRGQDALGLADQMLGLRRRRRDHRPGDRVPEVGRIAVQLAGQRLLIVGQSGGQAGPGTGRLASGAAQPDELAVDRAHAPG